MGKDEIWNDLVGVEWIKNKNVKNAEFRIIFLVFLTPNDIVTPNYYKYDHK